MNYRNGRNYENLQKSNFPGVGKYGIPELAPTQFEGTYEYIPFNYALSARRQQGRAVHFFLDDYQFVRLWNRVDRYVSLLAKYDYVFSPDFSLYADFPVAVQIFNHFRKHWIGAYLQSEGIKVIPTITWSTTESFEWCFDGEPVGATVAVSCVGCMNSQASKTMFQIGYQEMIRRLQPETILLYGSGAAPKECFDAPARIIKIKAFQEKFGGYADHGR